MKLSASPKPASGPVRGLTWPILMARLWAWTGMTRSTAGAATAPRPALTSVRRSTPPDCGCDGTLDMVTSLMWLLFPVRVVLARLLEMLQNFSAQRGLLLRRPGAKALAALEAELAARHQL